MTRTADEARRQLSAALARGFDPGISPRPGTASVAGARDSAVLLLFGVLDEVPAAPDGNPPVSSHLDILLTRRADHLRHHPGQIAFPGGRVERGDPSRADTALREAAEETGLDPAGVEVLGEAPAIHIPVSRSLVTPVIGWWRLPSAVAADHTESVEVFRVPVAELLRPSARGTAVLRSGSRTFRGAGFRLGPQFGGHIVWGFTGMLMAGLFDAAGWSEPWDRTREFPVSR